MIRLLERRGGWGALLLLAALGLLVGFIATRLGRHAEPDAGAAAPAPAAAVPAASSPPPSRGSSLSVVGGLTPEEAARLGIRLPDDGTAPGPTPGGPPAAVAPVAPPPQAMVSVSGLEGDGPPTAASFPADVQQAATRYLCLCGCPHGLAECPCRDQPIGAGTMLAYLEKHLRAGASGSALDAAMVDRYGERVLAPASR